MSHILLNSFFACTFLFHFAEAKTTTNRIKEIVLNIQMGDKISQIKIDKNRDYLVNVQGNIKRGKLSKRNFDFISKKATLVNREKSNSLESCTRSHIQLYTLENNKSQQRVSCVGSKNQISKTMLDLLKTVAIL